MENNQYEKEIKKFTKDVSNIRLSAAEKSALKSKIFSEIGISVPQTSIFHIFQNLYVRNAFMVAMILVVVGVPVAFASERSLPGDALYSLKTNVNEKVGNFFVAPSKKADYHLSLAQKRVEELTQLAETKKLDFDKVQIIERNLIAHSADILNDVEEDEDEEASITFNHEEDLLSLLATYSDVRHSIESEESDEEEDAEIQEIVEKAEDSLEGKIDYISRKASNDKSYNALKTVLENQVTGLLKEVNDSKIILEETKSTDLADDFDALFPQVTKILEDMNDSDEETIEEKKAIVKTLSKHKTDIRSVRESWVLRERINAGNDDKDEEEKEDKDEDEGDKEENLEIETPDILP